MSTRPIDANALRKRIEEWMQEFSEVLRNIGIRDVTWKIC